MTASFLVSRVLDRKLRTRAGSRRRPAEPTFRLPRGYQEGEPAVPRRGPLAGGLCTSPYLGMTGQIRRWSHGTRAGPALP